MSTRIRGGRRSQEEISLSNIKRRLRALDPERSLDKRTVTQLPVKRAADAIQSEAHQRVAKFGRRKPEVPGHRRAVCVCACGVMRLSWCRVDYNDEARKLFKALNLEQGETSQVYQNLNAVWRHPTTGAQVFIGNAEASKSRTILSENRITHIVNCTTDLPCVFQKSQSIKYHCFDIYQYFTWDLSKVDSTSTLRFFAPVLCYVESCLSQGQNVLVHCLAGAHRAGTTGIACVMYLARLSRVAATKACQAIRPVVDPICDLSTLLRRLDEALKKSNFSLEE